MRIGTRRMLWQAPLAVVLAGVVWCTLGPVVSAIPGLYLAAVAPELTRVDLGERRLPNRIVAPGMLVGLAAVAGTWLTTGAPPWTPLIAAVAFSGLLLVFALAGGMGMGDVKLAVVIGLASPTLLVAIGAPVLAFLSGGVLAVGVLIARGRGQHIPFGPFLLLGFFAALVVAELVA